MSIEDMRLSTLSKQLNDVANQINTDVILETYSTLTSTDKGTSENSSSTLSGNLFTVKLSTGNWGYTAIKNSNNMALAFKIIQGQYLGLARSGGKLIAVALNGSNVGKTVKFTSYTTYTTIYDAFADYASKQAVTGDMILAQFQGNIVKLQIKRNNSTEFVDWFSIDLTGQYDTLGFEFVAIVYDSLGTSMWEAYKYNKGDLYSIYSSLGNAVGDILKNKIPIDNRQWLNKKWACLGDSFTERNIYPPLVQKNIGASTIINYGISGSTIAYKSSVSSNPMTRRYTNIDNTVNLITVWGGVNDYGNGSWGSNGGIALGTNADTTDATFYGALRVLIEGLLNAYPMSKIAFITPTQMNNSNASLNYKNGGVANSAGFTLEQYVNAIIEMCKIYSIPCLDLFHFGGISDKNISYYSDDGLHPNGNGFSYLSSKIAFFLNSI